MYLSYFGVMRRKPGNPMLLGGVNRIESSRFQTREMAEHWLDVWEKSNPGNEKHVYGSTLPPEIFIHCEGAAPQTIGFPCSVCKKVLTTEDAEKVAGGNSNR